MPVPRERNGHPLTSLQPRRLRLPPRFSPRDWVEPPTAFSDGSQDAWLLPETSDGVIELMTALYRSEACTIGLEDF
jgi:hypothetical protein